MSHRDEDPKDLGATLAALRHGAGWTQAQLAEHCEVSTSTLSRHEAGEDMPSLLLLIRYCRELGLLPVEFFRVHAELQKSRRRLAQGGEWWHGAEAGATGRNPLDDRQRAERFAAAAAEMFSALLDGRERT